MTHPFRLREIAAQAGLSLATVDRVLHGRPGVRPGTVAEVHRAVAELERQRSQLSASGRAFRVDLVVQAPPRFSGAVRSALEAVLPSLRPALVRARSHLHDGASAEPLAATLRTLARRGSDGVVLKAPARPEVLDALAEVTAAGVPVVTLVTDLPSRARTAYVGLDNRAAGATAAYLLAQWLGGTGREDPGDVLVVRAGGSSRGEDERDEGFRSTLARLAPGRATVDVVDDEDSAAAVAAGVVRVLRERAGVRAVYSMYAGAGGSTAVLDAFAAAGRGCAAFVAHDLDGENAELLRDRRISVVLHHDLRADLRRACRVLLHARGVLPGPVPARPSQVQVVTPFNVPPVSLRG
ncbi:LacI family DNA-binding transcriptional regulator [Paenibacillus sp. TRM 82003]|uniref:LacI family DNA-binding transcriptional regulator n=1 Tax=Kineococcus sp. TRM81007 TaxID=2925831 RepID=UPI001F5A4811|nr:LacI family DNA-binding transcriptional regulator [Kineococcus sp. TRM81007]MCI2237470.1 LacI family DNA-binding transcriptional regulator [Kineococcus sp. TRM81007]MCI3919823.1 LacI family DNA-binding transcriptional regulator [Paenibacillus sp. TRM 82003]